MVIFTLNALGALLILIRSPAISVGWNTYEALSKPCVQYGTSSNALTSEACSADSATYPTSRTYSNSVTLTGLQPATTYYYQIVSTNSSIEHFVSPRMAGDKTPFAISVVIDLGVYGADGFTIQMDQTKRDTITTIEPSLNHTTISRLATNINDYEFVIHPGDFAYADDWVGYSYILREESSFTKYVARVTSSQNMSGGGSSSRNNVFVDKYILRQY